MKRRIGQVALVVSDRTRSELFYRDVLGMEPVFGTAQFRGPVIDQVQQMTNAASRTTWLIDDRDMFQLELFEFENPRSRPLPLDFGVRNEGYNRMIVAVNSIEVTGNAAVAAGGSIRALLCSGLADSHAHALLHDPDGIVLELVEAPELVAADRPARIIGLGLTSADLATTVEDMCQGFGFSACEDRFQHAAFWDEGGRLQACQTMQLEDMYLVAAQYSDSRPRPEDYRLGDIGVMNFAICFPDVDDFSACYAGTVAMGMRSNIQPMIVENKAAVTYHNDRQGFSVEMLYMAPKLRGLYGFARPRPVDRLVNRYLNWKSRREYSRHLGKIKDQIQGETL